MPNNYKVLLLEDDPDQIQLYRVTLKKLHWDIEFASSVKEAREILNRFSPDALITDLYLPDCNGIDFVEELRAKKEYQNLPIIMVSADNAEETLMSVMDRGVDEFLNKPIRPGELLTRVNNVYKLRSVQKQLEKEKSILSRYFSRDFVERILKEDVQPKLGGDRVDSTVLFFDLRGSTRIAEQVEPEQLSSFLSDLFTDIMDLVFGNGGSVNKLLGDGMLAVFGCPVTSPNDARNAVRTALAIREYISNYNEFRPDFLADPIEYGIGISSGQLFAGNIGSVQRMEYTVLGDPVNTASRLESLTKQARRDILIDGPTRERLGEAAEARELQVRNLRGKLQEISIHALMDLEK